jgi:nitrogen fixation/metabolism regulation signal transduction histidine kinase
MGEIQVPKKVTLRTRILAFVLGLIVLSLLGSTISLYRITEVNELLDTINRVSVPLGRLFTQMQSDADVFARELDRGLGHAHWGDAHWRPRPTPKWIEDVLQGEVTRVNEMIRNESNWAAPDVRARWAQWAMSVDSGLRALREGAGRLYTALDQRDMRLASELYPKWTDSMEDWRRQVQTGSVEYERSLRETFSLAQSRVAELRTGLEMVLIVVVLFSFLLLWLGDRALRPLAELTGLARSIARRGLRKEDKALFPEIPLSRSDEVSALAREFHRMATALLEREKTVEAQKHRLVENNRQLKEIGELNENILNSIESVLIVTDLDGRITQCNPIACDWLGANADEVLGTWLSDWAQLREFFPESHPASLGMESGRLEPRAVQGVSEARIYSGYHMPLHKREGLGGAIIVLQDVTDDLDLQERLRRAENLAAVGRMSAQVAHEVRNPLHSIGLEAELAAELAAKSGSPQLRQSLQSILGAVDRLDKITENYLKLSRLSAGRKSAVNLGQVLESVLATYANQCEAQGVRIDWKLETRADLSVFGDGDLLEQVFGNLLRNALQSLESEDVPQPRILFALGNAESGRVWARIEDNGPGIPDSLRGQLFTPFVTTRAQGTGLGLSFVKQVVEDHGGTVTCLERAASAEGQPGACFEITLPSAVAPAEKSPAIAVPPPFGGLEVIQYD